MSQPVICPVHGFERRKCTVRCFAARREMQRINALLRTYWWSRRRGTKPMGAGAYASVQMRQPPTWGRRVA